VGVDVEERLPGDTNEVAFLERRGLLVGACQMEEEALDLNCLAGSLLGLFVEVVGDDDERGVYLGSQMEVGMHLVPWRDWGGAGPLRRRMP
jgi:hypothetical protein